MVGRRTEIDGSFRLAGVAGQLHLSGGDWDDYLELVFPFSERSPSERSPSERYPRENDDLVAGYRSGSDPIAADLAARLVAAGLDAEAQSGVPPAVGVIALHVGDELARSRPAADRFVALLARVAAAAPSLDFGDLLPQRPVVDASAPEPLAANPPSPAAEVEPVASPSAGEDEPVVEVPLPTAEPSPGSAAVDSVPSPAAGGGAQGAAELLREARRRAARGQIVKARRAVEKAIALTPDLREAWSVREELGLLARREKCLAIRPRDAQAQLEVGFSRLALGLEPTAIVALAAAVRLEPSLYLGHLLLGMAYHRAGRLEEARRSYAVAARLRPSDATAADLAQCLARGEPPPQLAEEHHGATRSRPLASGGRVAAAG